MTAEVDLVERLKTNRDPDAFRELYSRHTPMLYSLALRMTGERPDAEDVVHDTWIRAVEGLSRFRGDAPVRAWLAGILINITREAFRSRARFIPFDSSIESFFVPLDEVVAGIDPVDLERALARMPPGFREVVVLHDVEGFTHAEISRMLGIESGTSKSQLARGRRWLRAALESGIREMK